MTSTHIAQVKRASRLSHDAGWGYLMVAPTILGLIILNIYPFFPLHLHELFRDDAVRQLGMGRARQLQENVQ